MDMEEGVAMVVVDNNRIQAEQLVPAFVGVVVAAAHRPITTRSRGGRQFEQQQEHCIKKKMVNRFLITSYIVTVSIAK